MTRRRHRFASDGVNINILTGERQGPRRDAELTEADLVRARIAILLGGVEGWQLAAVRSIVRMFRGYNALVKNIVHRLQGQKAR